MNFFRWYWGKLKESNLKMAEVRNKYDEDVRKARLNNPFAEKCPRCDSKDWNYVKPGMKNPLVGIGKLALPILLIPDAFKKRPKTLKVCRSCGFSREDR